MQTLEERDQELMSRFYGIWITEAGKTTPPNRDKAMTAVTKAIVKQVDVMEHGEMCQRVAHSLWNRFKEYAGKIDLQGNGNVAKSEKRKIIRSSEGGREKNRMSSESQGQKGKGEMKILRKTVGEQQDKVQQVRKEWSQ